MPSLFLRFLVFVVGYGLVIAGITGGLVLTTPALGTVGCLIIGCLSAVVLGAGVAKWLAMNFLKTVRQLEELIKAIDGGNASVEIEISRKDELGALAVAIGQMSKRDKALRQANEDPLTGLANRRYLMQKMENLFKSGKPMSLCFIDLDGFKPINDTYGHDMGDEALKVVSERFSACVRDNDVLARIGGDEFVMLFNGLDDRKVLETRVKRVLELVNEPIWISDTRLKMGASIGLAVSPQDGKDAESLLNAADEAMYAAKQGGKNGYRFYS